MLLALLLLHFKRKAASENPLQVEPIGLGRIRVRIRIGSGRVGQVGQVRASARLSWLLVRRFANLVTRPTAAARYRRLIDSAAINFGSRKLTAGSAKNEMPRRAQQEAIILPGQVIGTVSP